MPPPKKPTKFTEAEFIDTYRTRGVNYLMDVTGLAERTIHARRAALEAKHGIKIVSPFANRDSGEMSDVLKDEHTRVDIPITNGVVLVGSDGHYWPGKASTAHRAFVAFAKELRPKVLVMNGDAFDGASISRHPPIGWETAPTVEEELEVVQERLHEIAVALPKGCRKVWPLGNHDARFNTRLASVASEYRNVQGTRLLHHFPLWEPCWSVFLGSERGAVVKHRLKGGIHAPHNNTLWAGRTIVTGHLHSQKVIPISDYNGTRWGVDCGTLAHSRGPQFGYTEDNPLNWRSGFCVLTWKNGELLTPEIATVWDEARGLVNWRGELIRV